MNGDTHEHSHFTFALTPPGAGAGADNDGGILLDPWILFWQIYRDREMTAG